MVLAHWIYLIAAAVRVLSGSFGDDKQDHVHKRGNQAISEPFRQTQASKEFCHKEVAPSENQGEVAGYRLAKAQSIRRRLSEPALTSPLCSPNPRYAQVKLADAFWREQVSSLRLLEDSNDTLDTPSPLSTLNENNSQKDEDARLPGL